MDVKYNMDTKVEDNTRLYKLQKSNFDREINTAVGFCLPILQWIETVPKSMKSCLFCNDRKPRPN